LRYWGEDPACRYANVADQSAVNAGLTNSPETAFGCNDGRVVVAPIASYQPNRFGLYDVLGNVAQWTADCEHPDYKGAPVDGSAWQGSRDCARMIRGGGWMAGPTLIRASRRVANPQTARDNGLGFRVARDLEPPPDANSGR
jgi:formylglycine-generating enzyme required for sulfatase activity